MLLLFPAGAPWQRGPPRRERNPGGCSRALASVPLAGRPGAVTRPCPEARACLPAHKGGGGSCTLSLSWGLSTPPGAGSARPPWAPAPPPRFLHVGVWAQPTLTGRETGDRAGSGPRLLLTIHSVFRAQDVGLKPLAFRGALSSWDSGYCLWRESTSAPCLLLAPRPCCSRSCGQRAAGSKALWLLKDPRPWATSLPLLPGCRLVWLRGPSAGAHLCDSSSALPIPTTCPSRPSLGGVTRRAPGRGVLSHEGHDLCVPLPWAGREAGAQAVSSCGPFRGLTWMTAQLVARRDLLVGGPPSGRDISRPPPPPRRS